MILTIAKSVNDQEFLSQTSYSLDQCEINFSDLIVKKPWGFEYLLFENSACAIWILKIEYMHNTSMHCHINKNTSLVCIDGQISSNTLVKNHILNPLDALFIPQKVFHQTNAISLDGAYVLEIESPVNKFDLVRINDNYGRRGKDYEDQKFYHHEKNLTLNLQTNTSKKIQKTHIELIEYTLSQQLDSYNQKTTLVTIISAHPQCAQMFILEDFDRSTLNTTLLLLSRNNHD